MSRRYLRLINHWAPIALSYYNEWPVRPECGHFFGGVYWYGQETAMTIFTLALLASSTEFDEAIATVSATELRQIARKGLRYLLFTHDTGPADCVRPKESWGRPEPANTKWGERGLGFFRESQCGLGIANLTVTAALLDDLLGEEERTMLAAIAEDYLARFGEMAPKSGVYYDTQTEENAWTACGLSAATVLLAGHPNEAAWLEQTKLWMFHTTSRPQDTYNYAELADGKTVRALTGRTYTTLPDGTAENHGFVHPNYMMSALTLSGVTLDLLGVFQRPIPPHLLWRRQDTYETLKPWSDVTGNFHSVQGMDWPYFAYPSHALAHAIANLYLHDPDAALLERYALDVVERSAAVHDWRMIPKEIIEHCHSIQDPALMMERTAYYLAQACLAHRLEGVGAEPTEPAAFEAKYAGIHYYPHGGALVHRHAKGLSSLAWRNRTMAVLTPKSGSNIIGPAEGSLLATIEVADAPESTDEVVFRLREAQDRAAVLLVQDLAQHSVRRYLYMAFLPDGSVLSVERLVANRALTVNRLQQGLISVINDGFFGDHSDGRGHRTLHWAAGAAHFTGYPTRQREDDIVQPLDGATWVNVDDRFGLIFQGSGPRFYYNRHHFPVWHAIKDDLVLSLHDEPFTVAANAEIARFIALWRPEQEHSATAAEQLQIHVTAPELCAVTVDNFLCTANFSATPQLVPVPIMLAAGSPLPLSWGVSATMPTPITVEPQLAAWEPGLIALS